MAYLDYYYVYECTPDAVDELKQQIADSYTGAVENFYKAYNGLSEENKAAFKDIFGKGVENYTKDYDGSMENPLKTVN